MSRWSRAPSYSIGPVQYQYFPSASISSADVASRSRSASLSMFAIVRAYSASSCA